MCSTTGGGGASSSVQDCSHQDVNWCDKNRRSQHFAFVNGYRFPKEEGLGPGNLPIPHCRTVKDLMEIYGYDPLMTYGPPQEPAPPPVVPSFVVLEKKVLRFLAYYKETVNDSSQEIYRVRPVEIFYYLEDDSIMVQEPRVENSGLMQGKFLRRHRIPKNDIGEIYHWKDLNLACDIMLYGRVFRICDCDAFTMHFYESEGIILNCPEVIPKDPYIDKRILALQKKPHAPKDVCQDVRYKFLQYGTKALKFCCVWDDRESHLGGLRKMELSYFLSDDTVEVREVMESNSGRDPFVLHRTRLPKDWKDLPNDFPSVCLEPTPKDQVEYYRLKDLYIGVTIIVFGRRFLICDMDENAKQFYRENFNCYDFTPIRFEERKPCPQKLCPPPWNGWGSPEDSLQSWLHIRTVRPKVDELKNLLYESKVLKFGALLDSTKPEDQGREFIITCRLRDDNISVYETPVRNSGWPGGMFLNFSRVTKPQSTNDCPEYYGPWDLYIGAMLDFYGHRFVIKCAHPFVLEFINENPCCFPEHVKQNIRQYFEELGKSNPCVKPCVCDPGPPVHEEPLGEGFFESLGCKRPICVKKVDPCSENPYPSPRYYEWNRFDCDNGPCLSPSVGNANAFKQPDCSVMFSPMQKCCRGGVVQNPIICEEPQSIVPEEYYALKEHRFDFQNLSEDESRWRSNVHVVPTASTCVPSGQSKTYCFNGMLTQAPHSFGACSNCGCKGGACGCSTS